MPRLTSDPPVTTAPDAAAGPTVPPEERRPSGLAIPADERPTAEPPVAGPPPGGNGNGAEPPGPPPTSWDAGDHGSSPPPPPPVARRASRARQIWVAVVVLLLTAFVISATVVPLPYYAFKPGSVRDTEPLISVGDETRLYPAEGSISYTTVSLRQATLLGLVTGWLDDDIDIHPEDEVLGNRDAAENRTFNLQLMDNSKNVAAQVALERLGYDVDVSSDGVVVLRVEPGTPADGVLESGDTITSVDGTVLDTPDSLSTIMSDKAPGDRVAVAVESLDGVARDEELTLTAAPDDPARGVMGVVVQPRDVTYDFPIDVQIETGDVGGPSAGLAFTLGLLDDLTPGELTGGVPIAATGEILSDGTVGQVGGTGQKAATVREAGIGVFLVPSADYADAVAHAGDVDVIAVDTLDDALDALAELGGNADDLPQVGAEQAAGAPG